MRLFANIISFVFHPLLMITYGVTLALMFSYLAIYPLSIKGILISGVFFSSGVIPGFFILLMVKNGSARDVELTDKKERLVPYLIIIASNFACLFFLYKMMMPYWIITLMAASIGALLVSLCINFFWKISAHLLGIGGLMGAVMGVCRVQTINPWEMFVVGFICAGLLVMSRIWLKRHTPMQAYCGFLLGFVFTFSASLLSYIYLFI